MPQKSLLVSAREKKRSEPPKSSDFCHRGAITTKSFVAQIEELVKTKRMPYLDAILYICNEKDIEPERIVRFIDKVMKEKLVKE